MRGEKQRRDGARSVSARERGGDGARESERERETLWRERDREEVQ